MEGHFDDVKHFFRKGETKDTFAKHFVRHFSKKPSNAEVRKLCSFKILQNVNPFSFCKSAKTYGCRLCLAEKSSIVNCRLNKEALLNENSEIYGACKHCPKFHRFRSTDERRKREKGENSDGTKKREKRKYSFKLTNRQCGALITKLKPTFKRVKLKRKPKPKRMCFLPEIRENEVLLLGR